MNTKGCVHKNQDGNTFEMHALKFLAFQFKLLKRENISNVLAALF